MRARSQPGTQDFWAQMGLGRVRRNMSHVAQQAPHGKNEETNTRKRNPKPGRQGPRCWEPRQADKATCCAWELDPCALLTGSGCPASSLPGLGQCLLSPFLGVDPHLWLYLYCRVRLYPITQASGLYSIKKKFPAPYKAGNT